MKEMILLLVVCLAGGAVFLAYNMQQRQFTWPAVKAHLDARWGHIPRLPPAELAAWLADPAREPPQLIDARSAEEFAVSRLPGPVVRTGHAEGVEAAVPTLSASRPVVVYCANGLRAAPVAHRLRKGGLTDVQMLDGGIFIWAAEGLPMVDDRGPVRVVHPFTKLWARLVDESVPRSYQPDADRALPRPEAP